MEKNIMEDRFGLMLRMQNELQKVMGPVKGRTPADLEPEERATFLTWNAFALEDEIHEAMQETGWKPWATSRHLNADLMMKEMVDAWHFFMNILLTIGAEMKLGPDEVADLFTKHYIIKHTINAQRQAEGYDGIAGKCSQCHRDLKEVGVNHECEVVSA